MQLIGPKSVGSKLYRTVKVLFYLAALGVFVLSIGPLVFSRFGFPQRLSFEVHGGPLQASFSPVPGADPKSWIWIWGMELVSRICHALILYLLMRILDPVAAGEPFHAKMPNRLRMMGGVVVIGSLLRTAFCAALINPSTAPGPGAHFSWAIDFDAVFMGVVLVVLAEVFRRGYALKTESELTV